MAWTVSPDHDLPRGEAGAVEGHGPGAERVGDEARGRDAGRGAGQGRGQGAGGGDVVAQPRGGGQRPARLPRELEAVDVARDGDEEAQRVLVDGAVTHVIQLFFQTQQFLHFFS